MNQSVTNMIKAQKDAYIGNSQLKENDINLRRGIGNQKLTQYRQNWMILYDGLLNSIANFISFYIPCLGYPI